MQQASSHTCTTFTYIPYIQTYNSFFFEKKKQHRKKRFEKNECLMTFNEDGGHVSTLFNHLFTFSTFVFVLSKRNYYDIQIFLVYKFLYKRYVTKRKEKCGKKMIT